MQTSFCPPSRSKEAIWGNKAFNFQCDQNAYGGRSTLHQKCRYIYEIMQNLRIILIQRIPSLQGGSVIYEAGEVAAVWPVAGVYPTNK